MTQEKHNFAQLQSIDLSLMDSDDPAVVDGLVQQVKKAIREDGFLFLENYGVSLEQVCLRSDAFGFQTLLLTLISPSFIVNFLSRNTCTATSPTQIRNDFSSTPILANGQDTNILMASR